MRLQKQFRDIADSVPVGMKMCSRCKIVKPLDDFHNDFTRSGRTSSRSCRCKLCQAERGRAWRSNHKEERYAVDKIWRKNNPDKVYAMIRRHKLKKEYGLTIGEYDNMVNHQLGRCAICGTNEFGKQAKLDIDHCHDRGYVRGLLCGACNRALGLLKDNVCTLNNAIKYLEKGIASEVVSIQQGPM